MFENVAIVGYGESEYHRGIDDQKDPMEYMAAAINETLRKSGLELSEVNGFASTSFDLTMENVSTLAHSFGIDGEWFLDGSFGGASPIAGLIRGATAIERGDAETVVVVAGDSSTPASNMELVDNFNLSLRNGMSPYGFGGANGLFALIQRRHMHEFGTTRRQLGTIATTFRDHARQNGNAIFQEELTLDRYLEARPIVEPIHLFDCVLPCGGGGAIALTTAERADELDTKQVRILSGKAIHNPNSLDHFGLSTGFKRLSGIFSDADIDRQDVDCLQFYDNYPIMVAIQLEDFGFCEKGAAGEFIADTDLSIPGELPMNTGGGQLSMGQAGAAGGILGPIEAVRQLMNEAGSRQAEDCSIALSTGFGMLAYGGGLSSSAVILERGAG